ncbi:hypothetical protein FDECE_17132 [Fusarium decemcellulare]|nr:hypothetical protein FDECE_17132 [Fusarium decemcellulare]
MPTPKPDMPPYRDFHTCRANFVYEKPSPLRIVKYDTNAGNNIHDATSHIRTNNARVGQVSPKADESLIAPKRRRLDQDGGAAGKENLRTPQGSGSAGFEDREALQGTKARQHDGSPPWRLGVTPPPQLTVRKTRQSYTHARAQTSPCEASSLSCTFPASHGLRRSVKCRPPLSNICDEAVVLAESPPSTLHAPGRVEASLPSSRRISAATSPVPLLLQSRVTYMLVPHVVITPEVTALEAGRHRLWVAIEVSSRLWPVPGIETKPGSRWKLPGQFMGSEGLSEHDQRGRPTQAPHKALSQPAEAKADNIPMPAALSQPPAPLIPQRLASLQRNYNEVEEPDAARSSYQRRAVKQATSRCGSTASTRISAQRGGLPPPSRTPSDVGMNGPLPRRPRKVDTPRVGPQTQVDSSQRVHSETSGNSTLWKRRSLGAETLRNLFPLMADLSIIARDQETRSEPVPDAGVPTGPVVPAARAKDKKDAGRWGWGAWF